MVHLEEITDDVAEKLKLAEASRKNGTENKNEKNAKTATKEKPKDAPKQGAEEAKEEPAPPPGPASAPAPQVAGPELPPALAMTSGKTAEEILADLNKSPLFMTELEENDDVAALQALAYEGTPLENASDFKERGNECFREHKWADAREFYGKGIALLVGEDQRRARGEVAKREPDESGELPPDPDSPAEIKKQHAVLEQLYANRAACQLELRNYRACTLDCGAALRLNPASAKAWFRSAKALLALGKTDEARAACDGGLAADPNNAALQRLARDVAARAEAVAARKKRDDERAAREKRKAQRLRAVLRARGVKTRATAQPPEMEDAVIKLENPEDDGAPDRDVSKSTLSYPTILLYPLRLQSDFVKAFRETESLADHLEYILPPPWDDAGAYRDPTAVDCYMETASGGLIKAGKKMALGKILAQADVEVVDEVVRVFVVPRGEAAAWVQEFKSKKAAERGQH